MGEVQVREIVITEYPVLEGFLYYAISPTKTASNAGTYILLAVKTNITLPSWLREWAGAEGINLSQTLQTTLKQMYNAKH